MKFGDLLVLGLNPAWQRLFLLDQFKLGAVHRLPQAIEFASGKGVNLCRVLQRLGSESLCVQFVGGVNGDRLLAELDSVGVFHVSIPTQGQTRICTTLSTAEGESTELIEPSQRLTQSENQSFMDAVRPLLNTATRIAVCGTAPQGFHWDMLCALPIQGKRVYVDAWTGVEAWLGQRVELLKVNAEELAKLLGYDSAPEVIDVFSLAKQAMERFAPHTMVVTQGSRRVLVFTADRLLSLCPPRATPFVNAIGAGDSFLAGWIHADEKGLSLESRLARAVAVSVVRCEVELPWSFDIEKMARLEIELKGRIEELAWNF